MERNLKAIRALTYAAVAAFASFGAFFCAFYAPYQTGLFAYAREGYAMQPLRVFALCLDWACSLPCFAVLVLAVSCGRRVGKGGFFCKETVRELKIGGLILIADCLAFLVGNLVLVLLLRDLGAEVLYCFLAIVGGVVGGCMFFSSGAVSSSIAYKEDSEAFV